MSFLNWRESAVTAAVSPHPRRGSIMTLEVSPNDLPALIEALEEVFSSAAGELRLELPNGWTVFWKEREGESRLLLARPDAKTWIATAALTPEHGKALVGRLREGEVLVGEVAP